MNRARRYGQFDRIVGDDRPIPAGQIAGANSNSRWMGLPHADRSRLI
jgi:hypothetical protein